MNRLSASLIWIGFAFCLSFLAFTFLLKENSSSAHADFDIITKVQYHTPRALDVYLTFFSALASVPLSSAFIVAVFLFAPFSFFKKLSIPVLFTAGSFIELFGKIVFNHPPPPHMFFRIDEVFGFPDWYIQPGISSYPSGHSFRFVFFVSICIAIIVIGRRLSRAAKIFCCAILLMIAFAVLYSRVSLGAHWPSDVVGGSLLGVGLACLAIAVLVSGSEIGSKEKFAKSTSSEKISSKLPSKKLLHSADEF